MQCIVHVLVRCLHYSLLCILRADREGGVNIRIVGIERSLDQDSQDATLLTVEIKSP